jgi:hypothetical protein
MSSRTSPILRVSLYGRGTLCRHARRGSAGSLFDLNPPLTWEVRGIGRIPVIAIAQGTITPLDGNHRSLVTISLEFDGHGIGKLLIALLIRRQARKQLPRNQQKLKNCLSATK